MSDSDLDALAAEYPQWRIHRNRHDGEYTAWLPGTQPPLVVRAATVDGLREAIGQEAQDGR